jgi:hypothetical protein
MMTFFAAKSAAHYSKIQQHIELIACLSNSSCELTGACRQKCLSCSVLWRIVRRQFRVSRLSQCRDELTA